MTPVPGCSKENTGGNYCINPEFEGAPVNQQLDGSLGFNAHSKVNRKLFVCEGDCDKDSHCEDGLVCFKRNQNVNSILPPGCTGTPIDYMDYCIYPELTNIPSGEVLNNDGAFIRVGDDGTVKVFSKSIGELIWSSDYSLLNETALFDIGHDISIHLATHLLYAGDYSHSSVIKEFDSSEGGFHADSNSIEIYGSISFAYELLDPVRVSALSMISFNITLGNGIEALAICMDDDLTPRIDMEHTRAETTCLSIAGTSIETVLQNPITLLEEPPPGTSTRIDHSLKGLFPTRSTTVITYIGIVQITSDNGGIESSPSLFESIQFYDVDEGAQGNGRRLVNIGETCPAGELSATMTAGLQDTLQDEGDFCVSSLTMLNQIVLEEGAYCLLNTECRSGLCESDSCKSRVRSTAPGTPFAYTPERHKYFLTCSTVLKGNSNFSQ